MIINPFVMGLLKRKRKPPKDATRREVLSAGERAVLSNRKKNVKVTLAQPGKDKR